MSRAPSAVPGISDVLQEAQIAGPQIIYVDSTGAHSDLIVLTRDIGPGQSWEPDLTDRERVLIRALLHLAQDRLDHNNPHD